MTAISKDFTVAELTFSQIASRQGIPNIPSAAQLANLEDLCTTLLEPARALLACPLHVDSGYRSPAINTLVGGASDSAHLDGRAADIIPIGWTLLAAFHALRGSVLPFDQIIFECNAWIHLAIAEFGSQPRRQALIAQGGPGHWSYKAA
jgi:zinc D-Ala-D-Ala carboxypeptidase